MDMAHLAEQYIPLIIVLIVAFTFHEFAHAWSAWMLGDDTAYNEGRVTLNPLSHLDPMGTIAILVTGMFGWARPVPVNPRRFKHPRRDDIIVTAAGPVSNLIIAFIAAITMRVLMSYGVFNGELVPLTKLLRAVLLMMIWLNIILFFFNIIPLGPLDGSHIVKNMLPLNEAYNYTKWNEEYGMWALMALILIGPLSDGSFSPLKYVVFEPSMAITRWLLSVSLF